MSLDLVSTAMVTAMVIATMVIATKATTDMETAIMVTHYRVSSPDLDSVHRYPEYQALRSYCILADNRTLS